MYNDNMQPVYRRRVEDDRKFWKYVIFGFLTLGIYRIYWEYCINEDINTICEPVEADSRDRSMNYLLVCLLSIITFSIYFWFWIYKQGDRVKRAGNKYGVDVQESGSTYLIWGLLGVAISVVPTLIWTFSGMSRISFFTLSDLYRYSAFYTSLSVFRLIGSIGSYIMWYILGRNVNKTAKAYNYKCVYNVSDHSNSNQNNGQPYHEQANIPPVSGDIRTGILAAEGMLHFTRGEYKGQDISLYPTYKIVLGRNAQTSQLIFHDPNISRTHCLVEFVKPENSFYVTDYSSRGTWMNGSMRLKPNVRQKCPPGTSITLTDDGVNEFMLK